MKKKENNCESKSLLILPSRTYLGEPECIFSSEGKNNRSERNMTALWVEIIGEGRIENLESNQKQSKINASKQ